MLHFAESQGDTLRERYIQHDKTKFILKISNARFADSRYLDIVTFLVCILKFVQIFVGWAGKPVQIMQAYLWNSLCYWYQSQSISSPRLKSILIQPLSLRRLSRRSKGICQWCTIRKGRGSSTSKIASFPRKMFLTQVCNCFNDLIPVSLQTSWYSQ